METCRHPSRGPLRPFSGSAPCQNSSEAHTNPGTEESIPWWKHYTRKYIVLCLTCGAVSILLGVVFVVIYFILRSYTSSLQFFETIPTYVPAVVLVITGLMVMCFAKRKNRYAYLVKLAGGCCLICALLCVVITVTTTVVHMNRLQTLHECVYTPKAKTCMCVSAIVDSTTQDGTHRFVFNNTPNCEVVHGSLSVCLRVLFGLSVVGILVCIFSSMLVYQLLTHEKKKAYLEQLELRRRFLHRQRTQQNFCSYCEDPWYLWEMLNYGAMPNQQTDEAANNNNGRWNWWPWSGRTCNGIASRLVRYGGSDGGREHSCTPSPGTNESLRIYRNRGSQQQPVRFGPHNATSRHWHRRTRSNDGVFHHLHFGIPHYAQAPQFQSLGDEVPPYMWGPPPPYSHPSSVENVSSVPRETTQLPYERRESEGLALDLDCLSTHSSKKSTPPSGRHFLYRGFGTEGISLTVGGPEERRKSEDRSCVVQVHVPGCVTEKRDVIFNTLPTRSSRKRDQNPFKSLSNIPLCLTRKLSGFKNFDGTLSLIETCYEVNDEMFNCSLEELSHLRMYVRPPSGGSLLEEDQNSQEECTITTPTTQSSLDFPATILELPSDYRSSMIVATSPSTPVTENVISADMVYAQSMPNLSISNSMMTCVLHRVPSSGGNTSTSQDFADFELDDDGSLVGFEFPDDYPVSKSKAEENSAKLADDQISKWQEGHVNSPDQQNTERPVVVVIRNVNV